MIRVFFTLFFLLCCSCSRYHWGEGKKEELVFLNMPYAQGDVDGAFTAAMIRQLGESSFFQYDPSSSFHVKVCLRESGIEHIGYRHDRTHKDLPKKSVLPTEGRERIRAEVSLIEGGSERVLLGPYIVEAEADFDFITQNDLNDLTFVNAEGMRESVLRFSMGQLEPSSSATDAARRVVLDHLAQKIVRLMTIKWNKLDEKQ